MALTFDQFTNRLRAMSAEFQSDVQFIVEDSLVKISEDAFQRAPGGGDLIQTQDGAIRATEIKEKRLGKNGGNIAAAIGYKVNPDKYSGSVLVDTSAGDIAAYVEFGTGQSAVSYLATTPPEWQAQARRFYINGKGTILAQPFLLPAFMKEKIEFEKKLKQALKDIRI